MGHELLRTQSNAVFESLCNINLNPADFEWQKSFFSQSLMTGFGGMGGGMGAGAFGVQQDRQTYPRLVFKKSKQFYFHFGFAPNSHTYNCCPGTNFFEEGGTTGPWEKQLEAVRNWAQQLKKEVELPNLWADLDKYQIAVLPAIHESNANTTISWSEAEDIAVKLKYLGDEINKLYSLNAEQNAFVRSKLTYLENAAKRLGWKDWIYLSLSVFQLIAMGLTLTPEQCNQLGDLVKAAFNKIIHLLGK